MSRKTMARRIMAGTLGAACLLAAATSQARILLNGIRVCCVSQNEIGTDEIFLTFQGARVTMGDFTNGVCRDSITQTFLPGVSMPVTVQLWEDDGNHWYDGDDLWASDLVSSYTSYSFHNIYNGGPQTHDYWYYWTFSYIP